MEGKVRVMFEIQGTVFYIAIVCLAILVFLLILNMKLKKFDPLDEPKGLVLMAMMGVNFIENMLKKDTNKEMTEKLGPYLAFLFIYIFIANISGLFGITPPTSNYSVTLTLAAITCIMIEVYSIKYNGVKSYVKKLFEPLAPFVVINIISKVGTLLSLSLRLFGNIIAGSILMSVVYQLLAKVSALIPVIGKFNFIGVIVCSVLHMYFDLFAGAMQTYLFGTLSVAFISNELPEEAKEK